MALKLKIVNANGEVRLVELQPGATLAILPGDTISLVNPEQGAELQVARSGDDLVIRVGNESITLAGFYAPALTGSASSTMETSAAMNSGRALNEAVRRIVMPLDRANSCASTSRS